jgi:hypothetical protein
MIVGGCKKEIMVIPENVINKIARNLGFQKFYFYDATSSEQIFMIYWFRV